jgi:hypothetical protein
VIKPLTCLRNRDRYTRGIRVGKQRVLRLLRTAHLLAPTRRRRVHGDRAHADAITTTAPDELWGTDANEVLHAAGRVLLVLRRD